MPTFFEFLAYKETLVELLTFGLTLVVLLVSWTIGQRLLKSWDDKKRIRDLNFELRREFHELYGEFRTNARFWKSTGEPTSTEDAPELFRRATEAEGRLDALLSDIACFKRLSSSEAVILGLYRQGYQTLRECLIGKPNRAVPYDHNTVEYRFFNQVSAVTSRLVLQARKEPDDELAWSTVRRIYSVRSSDWISAVQQSGNGRHFDRIVAEICGRPLPGNPPAGPPTAAVGERLAGSAPRG